MHLNKILIIQTAFLGDVVLATALAEELHHFFPNAKIDFLLRKGNEGILTGHPFLHNLKIWNKQKWKYWHWFKLLREIRVERYDVIVNVQRYTSTGLWTALSGAKEKIGFKENPLHYFFTTAIKHIKNGIHEVERNASLIKHLLPNTDFLKRPKLYPSFHFLETLNITEKPYVCIAPASVWFTKQLPEHKWLACIAAIAPELKIFLLGGSNDKILCESIKKKSQHITIYNLAGKLTLLESAALMAKAKMNYTNDSGPMHIASAMNAPITAIFCSTVPEYGFSPLSDQQEIIESKEALNCRPCGLHGFRACPLGHFKCAETIFFK